MSENQDPKARLAELEKELDGLARSMQRGARLTLILTVMLLAVVTGYFVYGYSQISGLLQPREIVDAAGGLLDDNISVGRQTVEQEIIRSAPFWAEQLSQQVIAAIPTLGEKMEGYILTHSEEALDEMQLTTKAQFRGVLRKHRDEFEALASELKQNEEASDTILAGIKGALEQELGVGMQRDAGELLSAIKTANVRLDALATGKSLSANQRLEREALMLVRRMQKQDPLPELPLSGAPFQGLVDRIKTEQAEADAEADAGDSDGEAAPTRAEASVPAGGDEPKSAGPSAKQVREDMAAVAAEAQALKSELATAIAAADTAANGARAAAGDARKETEAAAAATAELKEAIRAAREALDKVKAAAGEAAGAAKDEKAADPDKPAINPGDAG